MQNPTIMMKIKTLFEQTAIVFGFAVLGFLLFMPVAQIIILLPGETDVISSIIICICGSVISMPFFLYLKSRSNEDKFRKILVLLIIISGFVAPFLSVLIDKVI